MNKIVRLIALAAVVGTAVLSYSLPQTKAAKTASASASFVGFPVPGIPPASK